LQLPAFYHRPAGGAPGFPPFSLLRILGPKTCGCNGRETRLLAALTNRGKGLRKKRTIRTMEVTIETEESFLQGAGVGHRFYPMWCPNCRRQVQMVTPEHAAQIAGVTARTVYRWADAGCVHFVERGGHLLICFPALSLHTASTSGPGPVKNHHGSKG
jgi:hypothetical protein